MCNSYQSLGGLLLRVILLSAKMMSLKYAFSSDFFVSGFVIKRLWVIARKGILTIKAGYIPRENYFARKASLLIASSLP